MSGFCRLWCKHCCCILFLVWLLTGATILGIDLERCEEEAKGKVEEGSEARVSRQTCPSI